MSVSNENHKKRAKQGILRLDIYEPNRSSGGSVEFRNHPEIIRQATPTSQSTQLSVKWDFPERRYSNENVSDEQADPDRSPQSNERQHANKYQSYIDQFYMEPLEPSEKIDSENEDYSASVSAVIQRRASVRGRKKGFISPIGAASPMGHVSGVGAGNSIIAAKTDRRRSSVYTTSSGETAISLGENANNQESTKEQIFENIRLHKEVLQSVKMQPWSMKRKLRLVRQAKEYISRHEGALQERFAMSRSTKDLWARFKIVLAVKWQHFHREIANLSTVFVPWQLRIKEIESHFGSVVASYFTFLRWLFWVNIVIAFTLSTFVVLPEFFASIYVNQTDHRKTMLPEERSNALKLTTILNFEGYWKYSPLFYGYYSDYSGIVKHNYDLPLAYFITGLAVYIYSFWATLRKMAENSRMSKLSSKDDECIFSWKLFTGWDFMIGHAETAQNRIASVVLGFKEALLEEAEKKKDKQNWKIIVLRIFVNFLVTCLLVCAATAVVIVVDRSNDVDTNNSYWRRNEISFVITGITFFFPMCFEALGYLEHYHPRKQLRRQLGRIMLLNLLVSYTFIFALFQKIDKVNLKLIAIRDADDPTNSSAVMLSEALFNTTTNSTQLIMNITDLDVLNNTANAPANIIKSTMEIVTTLANEIVPNLSTLTTKIYTICYQEVVSCSQLQNINQALVTSLSVLNFSTTVLPELMQKFNVTNDYSATSTVYTVDPMDDSNVTMSTIFFDLYNTTSDASGNATVDLFAANFSDSEYFTTLTSATDDYSYDEYDNSSKQELWRQRRFIEKIIQFDSDGEEYADYLDGLENNESSTEMIYNNTSTTTESFENQTEFISSTIASFIENITFTETPDDLNITEISEKWMEFLTTLRDEYEEESDAINDTCYKTICKDLESTTIDDTIDAATEPTKSTPMAILPVPTTTTTNTVSVGQTKLFETETDSTLPPATCAPIINSITDLMPMTENESTDKITGIPNKFTKERLTIFISKMNESKQLELRKQCWETMFGQELVKLTVLDLLMTIITTLCMDFFRALFVRFMNKCWCWDLEKRFPKYGDFKIAENILHLVNNQGHVWMGMFFSPGLAILNLIKLGILMYFRSWAVLTCNVPHEVVFRASRSNNFYLALLLTMLFLCVLPVSYAIVWIEPSWHCGPFANHSRIHRVFTDTLKRILPSYLQSPLDKIASPSTVIPLLLLLVLIIYYLMSLTGALREANQDLKNQLRRERQEERRKMLQRVVNAKLDDGGGSNAIDRWRKVLEASSPLTPNAPGQPAPADEEKLKARREFLARIMKKTLRKSSNTSEDESHPAADDDDDTDTEQHESLPHDRDAGREKRHSVIRKNSSKHDEKKKTENSSRMKDLVEIGKKKTDPMTENAGATRATKPEKKVKVGSSSKIPSSSSNELEETSTKPKTISDRHSLHRQQSTQDSDENVIVTGQTNADKDKTNYEIINENNKAVHRKLKQKSKPGKDLEPLILDKAICSTQSGEYFDESDDDRTSYKEIVINTKEPISSTSKGTASSAHIKKKLITDNSSPTSQHSSDNSKTKADTPSPIEKHKSYEDGQKQPMKKLNSFLALVWEAVQAKKHEQDIVPPQQSVENDLQSRVKNYIDTSTSLSEDRSSTKDSDSCELSQQVKHEQPKQKRSTEPPKTKRQDSQASIWSDNIPVITISKTESDECILDKQLD